MVAAAALRAETIDEDGLEAVVAVHGTGPVAEEVRGLAASGHGPLIPLMCVSVKPLNLVGVAGRSTARRRALA